MRASRELKRNKDLEGIQGDGLSFKAYKISGIIAHLDDFKPRGEKLKLRD